MSWKNYPYIRYKFKFSVTRGIHRVREREGGDSGERERERERQRREKHSLRTNRI
jgi:hypothetical protein